MLPSFTFTCFLSLSVMFMSHSKEEAFVNSWITCVNIICKDNSVHIIYMNYSVLINKLLFHQFRKQDRLVQLQSILIIVQVKILYHVAICRWQMCTKQVEMFNQRFQLGLFYFKIRKIWHFIPCGIQPTFSWF